MTLAPEEVRLCPQLTVGFRTGAGHEVSALLEMEMDPGGDLPANPLNKPPHGAWDTGGPVSGPGWRESMHTVTHQRWEQNPSSHHRGRMIEASGSLPDATLGASSRGQFPSLTVTVTGQMSPESCRRSNLRAVTEAPQNPQLVSEGSEPWADAALSEVCWQLDVHSPPLLQGQGVQCVRQPRL